MTGRVEFFCEQQQSYKLCTGLVLQQLCAEEAKEKCARGRAKRVLQR